MAGDNRTDAGGGEELWKPGEAAAYLDSGPVKLGYKPRKLSRMVDSGDLRGTQDHAEAWRRILASDVRRLRARRLRELGYVDPDYELPEDDDAQ